MYKNYDAIRKNFIIERTQDEDTLTRKDGGKFPVWLIQKGCMDAVIHGITKIELSTYGSQKKIMANLFMGNQYVGCFTCGDKIAIGKKRNDVEIVVG